MRRALMAALGGGMALLLVASAHAQTDGDGWTWTKAAHRVGRGGKFPFVVPVTETGPWRGKKIDEGKLGFTCAEGDLRAVTKGSGLAIDIDGDLKPDHSIGGKPKPLNLLGRVDGKVVPYAMVFQSIAAPLNSGTWYYYRTGCWREARVGKTRVVVIDANANGRYDDVGEDMLVLGKRTHAQWLSRIVPLDQGLVELKVEADGSRIGTKAWSGATGTLDLSKGFSLPGGKGTLAAAVVRSEDGLSFDGAAAVKVPVGSYTLRWGVVSAGRKNSCMFKAELEVEVTEGETATAEFGGPVKIVSQFHVDDERTLEVLPDAVFLLGKAKEHYFNFTPSLRMKIEIRDADTRRIIARGGFGAG